MTSSSAVTYINVYSKLGTCCAVFIGKIGSFRLIRRLALEHLLSVVRSEAVSGRKFRTGAAGVARAVFSAGNAAVRAEARPFQGRSDLITGNRVDLSVGSSGQVFDL